MSPENLPCYAAVGVLVFLTAALGGTRDSAASSSSIRDVDNVAAVRVAAQPVAATADLPELVFQFRDALEAVYGQLLFESEARNPEALTTACAPVLAEGPALAKALDDARPPAARQIVGQLLAAAAPIIDASASDLMVMTADDAEWIHREFTRYRELAFDFAEAVAPAA